MLSEKSFRYFVFHHHLACLLTAVGVGITLFAVFKFFYPHPNMVMDSYVYIRAMAFNLGANSFPIGYSKFLQLFSLVSRNTTLLVWIQFLFLQAACLWFFFTFLFFFRPSKWVTRILFVFLFFNPILLYICNFIMADPLFTTLSLLWFTLLIWIIARPRPYMIFVHALLLAVVFTVRYNALYYPFAAGLILLLARLRPWLKVQAIALPFILIGAFVLYTSSQMQQLMGVRNFSPFGGWKLANNALYMYGHVCQERTDTVPQKFAQVDHMVRHYFHRTKVVDDLMDYESYSTGSFYAAVDSSPLVEYMFARYGGDAQFQNFRKWGPMGSFYGEYGAYLLKEYPLSFARYFMWPNMARYILPPREIFSHPTPYLMRTDDLGQLAGNWFGLKTLAVPPSYIDFRTALLSPFPALLALIHIAFILGFTGFGLFGGFKKVTKTNASIIIAMGGLWILDFCFNVTASPVVLRYQLFLMILEFAFTLQFLAFISADTSKSTTP